MSSNRGFASLAIASAVAGFTALSALVAAPIANADPVDNITATIIKDRAKYGPNCPKYRQNDTLKTIAQNDNNSQRFNRSLKKFNYPGERLSFTGTGDPAVAALNSTYQNGFGPMIDQCEFREYGVSFYRDKATGVDWVTIVIGNPDA